MNYRKLTEEELKRYGINMNFNAQYTPHINFAKKYYPTSAKTMVLCVHSEYNDSTYDNNVKYVIVYDEDGDELPPLRATAKECREAWSSLPIPGTSTGHYGDCESDEYLEDVVIHLNANIPDLYIKED